MANFLDDRNDVAGYLDVFGLTDDEASDFEGFHDDEINWCW